MVSGQQSLVFPSSFFGRKKTPTISPRIQLLWGLVGYSWFLTMYEDLSLKSRFPVPPGHAGLHREAGCPPPTASIMIPHALCSLLSTQKFRDSLTSTRLRLLWLPVVHKKWSSLCFSMINFARNDFQSSEFGLWRCYRLCTSLFPVLGRAVASASSLGCSEWLSQGWK